MVFFWFDRLTNITIPDSVISIGDSTFQNCESLTSITIPDSVISIGDNAFQDCKSLTSITIPDSVTSIGDTAFENCDNLSEIVVDENNKNFKSVNGVLFNKDMTTIIKHPMENSRKSYVIPNNVTNIAKGAFSHCKRLTNITIPNSVTNIEKFAFITCLSLTNIIIPHGITSIANHTFSSCESLTNITIPNNLTSIAKGAFSHCEKLTDVYYEGTEEQWNSIAIEEENEYLTNATIHFGEYYTTPIPTPTATPTGENIPAIGDYNGKLAVSREVNDNTVTFTITAVDGDISGYADVKLFIAGYNSEFSPLEKLDVGINKIDGNTLQITAIIPDSKIYKFMLWDKNLSPIINVIKN